MRYSHHHIIIITHGFIMNQTGQLPLGLLAQLVACCTSIAEIMSLNPTQVCTFFFWFCFCYCFKRIHNCDNYLLL